MKYKNPIIKGFNPDPSICKVGEDYYLAVSTFEYFPGIPIYHSTDLVNWEMIGHCITRESQLPMEKVNPSGGIWAPTIRYHEGTFYVTATFSEGGNFIVSAKDPASEWSDPVWTEMDGIDPSMFFENGEMYYCANDCGSRGKAGEGLSVAKMDVNTGKVIGEIKRVWTGTGGGFLEAPHIYRVGDWYYMIAAEGGTNFNHMVTAARSKSIWGPYESCPYNPILTNRNDASKQAACCGHGDLIEDNDGNWWIVHLGTRPASGWLSHLGRETFLMPVQWKNDWFYVDGNKSRIEMESPGADIQKAKKEFVADFNNSEWEKEWIFLKKRIDRYYSRVDGKLTISASADRLSNPQGYPTFAAIRQLDFECEINTEMDFSLENVGDEAGAVCYLTPQFMYRICKRRESDGDYIIIEKTAEDFVHTAYRCKVGSNRIHFRIKAYKDRYEFYYTADDSKEIFATSASTRFLSCEFAGKCFTGTVIGVYAEGKAVADVLEFTAFV